MSDLKYYRTIFEKVRDMSVISIEELMELTKRFDCRRVVTAIYLISEKLITVGEAIEGLEDGSNFFLVSNERVRR